MLRASWRIRKLALPQGMLPRQSAVKAFRSSAPTRAQPLEREHEPVEQYTYDSDHSSHARPETQHGSSSEAGPSNYFTSSRPSSSSYFPSPSTPESPFSAASLSLSSSFNSSASEQAHLRAIWNYINLSREQKDHRVATATWRQWQKLRVATKRYLSRQMHQQVLRTVVPSVRHMRPYMDAVRRQSGAGESASGTVSGWKRGQKARSAQGRGQGKKPVQSHGTDGIHTLPEIGNRFRTILEELDILGYTRPASHSPGSSPQDYRFALVYLARLGDSQSAEKIADTMRHRGVPLNIRHIDARLLALVRYLERSRYRDRSMSGKEVDGVVDTLWKILGDMNTHMGKGSRNGQGEGIGMGKRPRRVTMLMLVQAINLARRIFARAASAEASASANASATADAMAAATAAKGKAAARVLAPSSTSSASSTPSASSASSILPLGIPASRASITDKALELDLLLEEVLAKGYGIDLRHATFAVPAPHSAASLSASSSSSSGSGSSSSAASPGGRDMNGIVLLALVDHFGRKGELWKMVSVLHAFGETRPWTELQLDKEGRQEGEVGARDEEGEDVGLQEMLRREEEGRKGMTIFGRTRAAAVSPTPIPTANSDTQTSNPDASSPDNLPLSTTITSTSRFAPPSHRLSTDFYPPSPLTAPAPLSAPLPTASPIDTSYAHSNQRTDIYTTALAHSLRTDDWALTLHILGTAVSAAREARAQWIEARWGREMTRAFAVRGSGSAASVAGKGEASTSPAVPIVPHPRISLDPDWFLRTHVRMARHKASARHMAKLQDLMSAAMEDTKAEVRALAEMEGWAGVTTAARDAARGHAMGVEHERQHDTEAEAEAEAEAESWVQEWGLSPDEVEQLQGIHRLDEPLVRKGKGSSNILSAAPGVGYVGVDSLEVYEEVREHDVPPHMADSLAQPTSAGIPPPASSSASSPPPASSSTQYTPIPSPTAPPSRHLLTTLSTHSSLRSILAYSLHRKHLQGAVRTRANLRFEANQLLRKSKREEEERERAERAQRRRVNGRVRQRGSSVGEGKAEGSEASAAGGVVVA